VLRGLAGSLFHKFGFFMDWPRINQQNASNTVQEDTTHKTQFILSDNCMFWHKSAIPRDFNEPFVVIKWAAIEQSVY